MTRTAAGAALPPAEKILLLLQGVRKRGLAQWAARCPAHEDRGPSLSIRELPDSRVLVHCFAGCDVGEILAAMGLQVSDLFPARVGGDSHALSRVHKPWTERAVFNALRADLFLALVLLHRASRDTPLSPDERQAAGNAAARIDRYLTELSYVVD